MRADYDRVLKQRNALLRSAYLARKTGGNRGGDLSTLDVWDTHLAQHGAQLVRARLDLVAALAPHVAKAYDAVSAGRADARIAYSPSSRCRRRRRRPRPGGDRAALLAALARGPQAGGRARGHPGRAAPRRADTRPSANCPRRGTRATASPGRIALALRLAAYDLLRDDGIEPVLVLDDVFAELDAGRRERLAELVGGASQVIVTCAVDGDVPRRCAARGTRSAEAEVRRAAERAAAAGTTRRDRAVPAPRDGRPAGRADRGRSWPGPRSRPPSRSAADSRPRARRRQAPARRGRAAPPRGYSGPGPDPRDPQPFGTVLERMMKARGWQQPAAEATVFGEWERVVGADVAAHCRPIKLEDGELTVEAESTAWATQLRMLAGRLLARIAGEVGHNVVKRLHIHGPSAPSWSRGPKRVRGRGPRDTYG